MGISNITALNKEQVAKICLHKSAKIYEVAEIIQFHDIKFCIVCDDDGRLVGVITDGDIRRGMLNKYGHDSEVELIMNPNPELITQDVSINEIQKMMSSLNLLHLPLINAQRQVEKIYYCSSQKLDIPSSVLLMAGGLGRRLHPLTESIPKPLLEVGGKAVLEREISVLASQGFKRFYISVRYLGEKIEHYIGDGKSFGVEINYIYEDLPLGTAGVLSKLPKQDFPLVVMNGDIITDANIYEMLTLCADGVKAVIGVRDFSYTVPYGCIHVDGQHVLGINEKPTFHHPISAGIYILSPDVIGLVEPETYTDMPDLLVQSINAGIEVIQYFIKGNWIDIGSIDDLNWARQLYDSRALHD